METGKLLVPAELNDRLDRIFQSKTKTYQYAVVTQLLAKLVDPIKDTRCIQKLEGDADPSRFDASACSKVVVPWGARGRFSPWTEG
ncbi:MAG: restriction endonuclease, SacI family [Flavobacteriales bacterium]|nr:restriction endonuclease, SacI family [Flavobacteriales bacterium]